eukprot:CAMPEP_0167803846 /NCGR_PEP_ID=MMETSP0111_2-20121227/20106_1 /TAXON_ID=91324 /ORGANISM="Lotharella globosa, Strain CCCM811" /LENGTH=46 /DNA_ID= /DNA_START= /DNA_END= /DNA_ORIENTATION=
MREKVPSRDRREGTSIIIKVTGRANICTAAKSGWLSAGSAHQATPT